MTGQSHPLILKSNIELRQRFHELKKGDVVACVLNLAPNEDYLLLDMVERGVIVFPPAISQLSSRSKCCQATIFAQWMPPLTSVVRKKADLARVLEVYSDKGIDEVITKLDHSDCGLGICRWRSLDDVFNQVAFSQTPPYPFVIQPFLRNCTDIRIVWIGDIYREAYWRKNPRGFRNNLHFGGMSGDYQLGGEELRICSEVMMRGKYPYAHIDLLKTAEGGVYFSEISLFGGLKGAKISPKEAAEMKKAVEDSFIMDMEGMSG